MFDIGTGELLALAIIALFVFGPERLPSIARSAARGLRQVREMVSGAQRDLRDSLGPDLEDIDLRDLNPHTFVRKHVFDPADLSLDDDRTRRRGTTGNGSGRTDRGRRPLRDGERPPYDADAT